MKGGNTAKVRQHQRGQTRLKSDDVIRFRESWDLCGRQECHAQLTTYKLNTKWPVLGSGDPGRAPTGTKRRGASEAVPCDGRGLGHGDGDSEAPPARRPCSVQGASPSPGLATGRARPCGRAGLLRRGRVWGWGRGRAGAPSCEASPAPCPRSPCAPRTRFWPRPHHRLVWFWWVVCVLAPLGLPLPL